MAGVGIPLPMRTAARTSQPRVWRCYRKSALLLFAPCQPPPRQANRSCRRRAAQCHVRRLAKSLVNALNLILASVTAVMSISACVSQPQQTMPANGYVLPDNRLQTELQFAKQHDGEACYRLHLHYTLGLFQYRQGDAWLQRSAEYGSPQGMYGYGIGLWNTASNAKQKIDAKNWIRRAAAAGDIPAAHFLAKY